jgi:hypothetical protein
MKRRRLHVGMMQEMRGILLKALANLPPWIEAAPVGLTEHQLCCLAGTMKREPCLW